MSNVLPFPNRKSVPTFSCLDACSDGLFVMHTDENGHKEAFGPFPDAAAAHEFAANISRQSGIHVEWDTFPLSNDPRNGEVYATEWFECRYKDGQEIQTPAGFAVVHMSASGGSAGITRGFATMEDAKAGALQIARERGAVLS